MPGARRLPSGKLQGWYFDTAGRRRYWTSEDPTTTKAGVRAQIVRTSCARYGKPGAQSFP